MILGQRLGPDVTVTSPDPDRVRVLIPNNGNGALVTHLDAPPDADVGGDGAIQGLLYIAEDAPLGPVELIVRDSRGGATAITVRVVDRGRAAVEGYFQDSMTERAIAKSGAAAGNLPDILIQDFDLDHDTVFTKTGRPPVRNCQNSATVRYFRQRAAVYSLGETGQALSLASMLLGKPRTFDVLTFSAYLDAEASLLWNCDPPAEESAFDWRITLGFELVGIFHYRYIVRPWDGRIVDWGEGESVFDSFNFDAPPNDCVEVTPVVDLPDVNSVQVEQKECCPDGVAVSFTAPVHQGSIAAGILVAQNYVVMDTVPDEEECPCWIVGDWLDQQPEVPACPASELFLKQISFHQDHTIVRDEVGVSFTEITDPVWVDDNLDGNPDSDPDRNAVAYTAGDRIELEATFAVDPPVTGPLSQSVHIRGTGPDGLTFEDSHVRLSGSSVTVTFTIAVLVSPPMSVTV